MALSVTKITLVLTLPQVIHLWVFKKDKGESWNVGGVGQNWDSMSTMYQYSFDLIRKNEFKPAS